MPFARPPHEARQRGHLRHEKRKFVMTRLPALLVALIAIPLVVVGLAGLGATRWRNRTQALLSRLDATRAPITPAHYHADRELAGLPPPVQRFFRTALTDGQPIVAAAHITHQGSFNLAAEGPDRWRPFSSTQQVVTRRPGFVWAGRVTAMPGLVVNVHDAYIAGEGLLHPAVMGLLSLGHQRGTDPAPGGLAEGEFMRYLAEAAWYPTALLPSQGVCWTATDDHSARATVADGAVSVTLLMHFDPHTGLIDRVRAEARGRTLGKQVVMTPWEGRWAHHTQRDGMLVPGSGEVAWLTPQGRRVYWRGTVDTLRYTWAVLAPGAR